jgi:hypothetical protein
MQILSFLRKYNLGFLALSTVVVLMSSCGHPPSPASAGFEPLTDSLKNTFLSTLKGVWVPSKYIEVLKSSQSPRTAFGELKGHAVLVIPASAAGDSTTIRTSYKNHSDSSFVLYFLKGPAKGLKVSITDTVKGSYYTLDYLSGAADTLACLYHYSAQQKVLDSTLFTRVISELPEKQTAGWAIDHIVMKTLLAGEYWIHGQKDPGHVSITADGKINGLFAFSKYRVRTDFSFGLGRQDWIQLDTVPRENIFRMQVEADSIKMIKVGLRIKLVKLH